MVTTGASGHRFDQNDYRTPIVHCGKITANQFSFDLTLHALHMFTFGVALGMLSVGVTTSTAHVLDGQTYAAGLAAQVGGTSPTVKGIHGYHGVHVKAWNARNLWSPKSPRCP